MNKQENQQQQQELQQQESRVVTPPPFRHSEQATDAQAQAVENQKQAASPTLADRIATMGLDESTRERLSHLTEGMVDPEASDELLATLVMGITHDDDVQNADAAGYLRGRNEKIEAVLHPQPQDDDAQAQATPVFPRYCRRSIWD